MSEPHCPKCGGTLEEDIIQQGGKHCKNCIISDLQLEISELHNDMEAAAGGYVVMASRYLAVKRGGK